MLKFVVCVTCGNECGQHFCQVCKKPCHAIPPCSMESDAEEEGFDAPVVCKSCGQVEVVPKSSKTQLTKEGENAYNLTCSL